MGLSEGDDVLHGSINYPFAGPQRLLGGGNHKKDDRLVIRTAVGSTEYQLEVPAATEDMDVEIPIVPLSGAQATGTLLGDRPTGLGNPSSADRELLASLPQVESKYPSETGVLDKAFGTGPDGGYRQSPSYVLGIAKVNQHYRRREYEYAMVELNNLLAFYPNSPKLHKMKGTVLVRMGNLELAERAWERAQQLEPDDVALRNGLRQLQNRIAAQKRAESAAPAGSQPPPIPQSALPTAALSPSPSSAVTPADGPPSKSTVSPSIGKLSRGKPGTGKPGAIRQPPKAFQSRFGSPRGSRITKLTPPPSQPRQSPTPMPVKRQPMASPFR